MDRTNPEVLDDVQAEPFLSFVDYILLALLLGGAAYWLLKNKKKEPPTSVKSYSIQ